MISFFKKRPVKRIRILGWHGHNATGDDLLEYCVRGLLRKRALKMEFTPEFVEGRECDMLLIGGGTILGCDPLGLCRTVKRIRAPLVIFGGGFRREKRDIGYKNRRCMKYLFKRAELTGVRGYVSQQFFIHNGIEAREVIGDPGMLFKAERVSFPLKAAHKVGVFVRNMGKTGESQYVDNREIHKNIAQLCDWFAEEYKSTFYFFSFAENICDSDFEGIQSTISFMKHKDSVVVIPYTSDVIRQCSLIGKMDYVVSQRLHPVVIAWSMKKPCVAFDYQFSKTADFMNSIGMDDFVIRTDEFNLDIYKTKFQRLMTEKQLVILHSQKAIHYWRNKLIDFADRSLGLIR